MIGADRLMDMQVLLPMLRFVPRLQYVIQCVFYADAYFKRF
jgi:hypothetical protein